MVRVVLETVLKFCAYFVRYPVVRKAYVNLEMFVSALLGKGGGSGWDSEGQISALLSVCHPNQHQSRIVFDIGGNNGKWAAELYDQLGDTDAHFYIFECAPYCFEDLARNTKHIRNKNIIHKAVSNCDGELELHIPILEHGGSGLASIHERNDTSVKQYKYTTMRVPTTSIDSFCNISNIKSIDILKIDVEGHEKHVLEGCRDLLKKKAIQTVFFEFGSANLNSRTIFRDFWDLFTSNGFHLFRVLPGGGVLRIDQYTDHDEYYRGASNYIARLNGES